MSLTTAPSLNLSLVDMEDSMLKTLTEQNKTIWVLQTRIREEGTKKERTKARASVAEAKADKLVEKLRQTKNQLAWEVENLKGATEIQERFRLSLEQAKAHVDKLEKQITVLGAEDTKYAEQMA